MSFSGDLKMSAFNPQHLGMRQGRMKEYLRGSFYKGLYKEVLIALISSLILCIGNKYNLAQKGAFI